MTQWGFSGGGVRRPTGYLHDPAGLARCSAACSDIFESVNLRSVDNRDILPKDIDGEPLVFSQDSNDCVANATAMAIVCTQIAEGCAPVWPSRRDLYYRSRFKHGAQREDQGTYVPKMIEAVNDGFAPESVVEYRGSVLSPPTIAGDHARADFKGTVTSVLVESESECSAVLAAKRPVCLAMRVDRNFLTWDQNLDATYIFGGLTAGAHCMMIAGYDADRGYLVLNSWGREWGWNGMVWISKESVDDPSVTFARFGITVVR